MLDLSPVLREWYQRLASVVYQMYVTEQKMG